MDHRTAFEQLCREIEHLPLKVQYERLLAFFQQCARDMDADDVEVLKHHFALKGNDVADVMSEVLEGEQAVRTLTGR